MAKQKHKHALTKHHRKPTSIGGENDKRNISYVPRNQHEAWHLIFTNLSATTICAIINEKWIDPDYEFICRKKQ